VADFFFLIFEAQYPNLLPKEGLAGCRQLADFWADIAATDDTDAQIAKASALFYEGITDANGDEILPPVVNFDNYQSGQVRTNHFINFNKWQLREYRTAEEGGITVFQLDTEKDNPLAELYAGNGDNPDLESEILSAFDEAIERLMVPELNGETGADIIINGIGLKTPSDFDEFQSDAQDTADNPVFRASGSLRAMIEA
jgi:hypothetical protein